MLTVVLPWNLRHGTVLQEWFGSYPAPPPTAVAELASSAIRQVNALSDLVTTSRGVHIVQRYA